MIRLLVKTTRHEEGCIAYKTLEEAYQAKDRLDCAEWVKETKIISNDK